MPLDTEKTLENNKTLTRLTITIKQIKTKKATIVNLDVQTVKGRFVKVTIWIHVLHTRLHICYMLTNPIFGTKLETLTETREQLRTLGLHIRPSYKSCRNSLGRLVVMYLRI
jgi:argonaute-like protein implicated in RNA metabolism and viral defense